jgi:hypothetical protein
LSMEKIQLFGSSEPYVKPAELAQLLDVRAETILDWARHYPDFPCIHLPGTIRIRVSEVMDWLRLAKFKKVPRRMQAGIKPTEETEQIKQKILQSLLDNWTGYIEPRAGYQVFLDQRGQKLLRFGRFSPKHFYVTFSRWNEPTAHTYDIEYTGAGARYGGNSVSELEKLIDDYLSSIKSKYFGLKEVNLDARTIEISSGVAA